MRSGPDERRGRSLILLVSCSQFKGEVKALPSFGPAVDVTFIDSVCMSKDHIAKCHTCALRNRGEPPFRGTARSESSRKLRLDPPVKVMLPF